MTLIRDTDDERRARVEALICELLGRHEHGPEPLDPSRPAMTPLEKSGSRGPAAPAAAARR